MKLGQEIDPDIDWCLPDAETDRFLSQVRRGERPSIDELVTRFPDHAEQVRRQCRMMMFAERLGTNPHPVVARLREPPSLMRLDDYEIHRLIGRGGMGFVYKASKPGLSRRVAIKVLADQASTSRSLPKRFALEAEAASRLHHPNIVPVFDYGEFQGLQFLAMLYIDGCNLEQVVRHLILTKSGVSVSKGNAAPEECLAAVDSWEKIARLGAQAASGLQHAHQHGMIHRDIKPANLLLDRQSNLYIADFGLAKIRDEDSNLSRTGDTIGTPRYISPEALRGFTDERSDVFGLGVTLYELVSRTEAFSGTTARQAIQDRSILALPPLKELRPDVPEYLADIIMKACGPDPRDRFATAQAFQQELNRFAHGGNSRDRRRFQKTLNASDRARKTSKGWFLAGASLVAGLPVFIAAQTFLPSGRVDNLIASGAPSFTGIRGGESLNIRLEKGETAFNDVKLQCYDPDGVAGMYQISGGADADLFAVHPDSGTVLFRQMPNAGRPHDQNRDGIYEVDLAVTDRCRAHLLQFVDAPNNGGLNTFEPVSGVIGNSPWSDATLRESLLGVATPDGRRLFHVHELTDGVVSLYMTDRAADGTWQKPTQLSEDCGLDRHLHGLATHDGKTFLALMSNPADDAEESQLWTLGLEENGRFRRTRELLASGIPAQAVGLWMYDHESLMYYVANSGQLEQWLGLIHTDGTIQSSLISVGPWHTSLTMIDACGWIETLSHGDDGQPVHLRVTVAD
jgi:serine/threonine protein kinase